MESAVAGAAAEVQVRAGDDAQAGQLIARLSVAQLDASLTSKRQELEAVKQQNALGAQTDKAYAKRIDTALQRRRRVHAIDAGQALSSSIADIDVQLAEVRNQLAEHMLAREIALAHAQAAVLEVETLITHAQVRSPAAGRVESLLAKPGEVVQPGQLLAQIVPQGAPRSIVAFLPARETAFVAVGTAARVELESLPVSEFGMAKASVRRISADIADPQEQAVAFGQTTPGATVRVELEIESASDKMTPHLRSGERVIVPLHRRERRIISLMFDFARTLLGP